MAFDVVSIFNLFYFKRTLVVVIGSKLFPFSGRETDCSDSFSFGLDLELKILVMVYWRYVMDVLLMCQNVTGFQPLLLRENRRNMKTE